MSEDLSPYDELYVGAIKLQAENGFINIFFTLTPEKNPKVQQLDLSL